MTKTIDLSQYRLSRGGHDTIDDGMCAMELASHLAGERWGASPECVCRAIRIVMIAANDGMDDVHRNRLLLPLIPSVLNTRGSAALQLRRAVLVIDWCQRIALSSLLDRVDVLQPYATALRELPEAVAPAAVLTRARLTTIQDTRRVACRARVNCGDDGRASELPGLDAAATRVGDLAAYFSNPARNVAIAAGVGIGTGFEGLVADVFAAMPLDSRRPAVRAVWELYPELIRRLAAVAVPAD